MLLVYPPKLCTTIIFDLRMVMYILVVYKAHCGLSENGQWDISGQSADNRREGGTRALTFCVSSSILAPHLWARETILFLASLSRSSLVFDPQVDWYPGGNEVYFWNTKDKAKNLSRPCFGKTFCLKLYFPFVLHCTRTVYARPVLEYLFLTKIMLHGGFFRCCGCSWKNRPQ